MHLPVREYCVLYVSFERSKTKCVKSVRQLRCFRMAILVLDYEPITFTERRCENDQESVVNEHSDLQLPSDSCRFKVALFLPLMIGNCGPRLASEHSADMLTVFTLFSIFAVCLGTGEVPELLQGLRLF